MSVSEAFQFLKKSPIVGGRAAGDNRENHTEKIADVREEMGSHMLRFVDIVLPFFDDRWESSGET